MLTKTLRLNDPGLCPTWHATRICSSRDCLAFASGLPSPETLAKESNDLTQDSNTYSDEGVVAIEEWRSWLSVGDRVQIRDSVNGEWLSGVIRAANGKQVHVSFFRGNNLRIQILPLNSPDMQPDIAKATPESSPPTSEPGSDVDATLSDDERLWSSTGSTSSLKAEAEKWRQILGSTGESTVASGVSGVHAFNSLGESAIASGPGGRGSPDVPYMSQVDLARRLGQQNLQIIDVRDVGYLTSHIVGSRHVPCSRFESYFEEIAGDLAASGNTVVFYCDDSKHIAPICARRFTSYLGETWPNSDCRVYILRGGFQVWAESCSGSDDINQYINAPRLSLPDV